MRKIQQSAADIMKKFPRSSIKDLNLRTADLIIKNTNLYARTSAYSNIKEGERPSQDYIAKSWEIVQRLVATAGYRLTDILRILLDNIKI